MKKLITGITILTLVGALLTGCSGKGTTTGTNRATTPTEAAKTEAPAATSAPTAEPVEVKTITVGASATPHAEILEQIKPVLADQGYELKIVVYQDYVQPNVALDSGELDANYFQHHPT
jgi:D-methionine transport system substrate-binding protein